MAKPFMIAGVAAPLPVNNLDTDQIMPKQFLLGIDKSGLARGLLPQSASPKGRNKRPSIAISHLIKISEAAKLEH